MFKLDTKTKLIKVNRGDVIDDLFIRYKLDEDEYYVFNTGDVVSMGVYGAKALEEPAVMYKDVVIEEPTDEVYMPFSSEETKIGDIANKPIDYWYEIQLNHQHTIIGYDDDGAKIFKLYPEGSDITKSDEVTENE